MESYQIRSDAVVVVTGANAGLGYQLVRRLAGLGVMLVMACRSLERAGRARERLLAELPEARLRVMQLDVSEPESLHAFGLQFREQFGQLDLLINNAGIVGGPLTRNSAGYELQLATNYLGPFALTGNLLPFFRIDGPARIVNVGSLSHRLAKLDLDDINWEKTRYGPLRAYARSKLALLAFTMELNRRLFETDSNVVALAAHPGFAATEIGKDNSLMNPKNALGRWFNSKMEALIPSAEEASRPIFFAACDESAQGGDYYGPGGWLEIGGEPARARLNKLALDHAIGRRLWSLSEQLTGVSYLSDVR
jgi:NAD(P)-dependent dehydrogenase (short-subunit alcohol dehydrogenase family)